MRVILAILLKEDIFLGMIVSWEEILQSWSFILGFFILLFPPVVRIIKVVIIKQIGAAFLPLHIL